MNLMYYFDGVRLNCKHLNWNFFHISLFFWKMKYGLELQVNALLWERQRQRGFERGKKWRLQEFMLWLPNLLPYVQDSSMFHLCLSSWPYLTITIILALATTTILGTWAFPDLWPCSAKYLAKISMNSYRKHNLQAVWRQRICFLISVLSTEHTTKHTAVA